MALFITHGIFASLLTFLWRDKKTKFSVFFLIFVASIIPDIDYIFQTKNDSQMFGHRGITHSLFFAGMIGVIFSAFFLSVVKSFNQSLGLMLIFFSAAASHSCLDAMTEAPYGVCFFCPFNDERYFFPITLFTTYTPIAAKKTFRPDLKFTVWAALLPEILWVWIPTFTIFWLNYYLRKPREEKSLKTTLTYKPIQNKPKETSKIVKKNPPSKKKR